MIVEQLSKEFVINTKTERNLKIEGGVEMTKKIITILCLVAVSFFLMGFLGFSGSSNKDVNDIIKLLRANVGEEVIKAHIEKAGMSFDLSTKDLINLKKAGASDELLSFMVSGKSGGEFPFELGEEFLVKKPITHEHLAIFPVYRKAVFDIEEYLTLDEAQETKVIIITEQSNASVPTVIIRNIGRKSIYIMAGEIIIGGKQDRMVSFDVLIPPGKEIEVSVRCVEHGRWHGKSGEFKSGKAVGKSNIRVALQFKDQTDVWNEVSKACAENEVTSSSGTYGALLSSEDVEKKSKTYLDAMKKGLKDNEIVGMIVAVNGEVVCVDIFTNPKFFAKVKEKLLKSYVLDAITTDITSRDAPEKQNIIDFFDELKVAKTNELKKYKANCNVGLESERMIGNESRDDEGRLQHLNLYQQ